MNDSSSIAALRLLQAAADFKARLSGDFASVHGLSVNDFLLLLHLEHATAHRLTRVDLAKRMHISASTVTRMARPMEKVGLLARETHERDARMAFVVLTSTGRTKFRDAHATFQKHGQTLFADRWTDADVDTLGTLLHRLVASAPWGS